MNTDQLNAFLFVARHRSFARAAQELGISDRRISDHIKRLEKKLGVRLIDRDTQFRGLTAKGKVFARFAEALAGALNAVVFTFKYETSGEAAVQSEIGPPLLVLEAEEALRRFREDYPLAFAADAGWAC